MKKTWILLVLGFILGSSLIAFGIGSMFGDNVQEYYYHFNPPTYNPPPEKTSINSTQLLNLLNEKRQKKSLKPLKENKMLDYVAYIRAKTIFDKQEYTHEATRSGLTYSTVANKLGYFYKSLGENIAIGYTDEEQIITDWEKSKEHADIMFRNDYAEAGTYTLEGKFYGKSGNVTVLILGK
jgi:uncharacterized protein YkwD